MKSKTVILFTVIFVLISTRAFSVENIANVVWSTEILLDSSLTINQIDIDFGQGLKHITANGIIKTRLPNSSRDIHYYCSGSGEILQDDIVYEINCGKYNLYVEINSIDLNGIVYVFELDRETDQKFGVVTLEEVNM